MPSHTYYYTDEDVNLLRKYIGLPEIPFASNDERIRGMNEIKSKVKSGSKLLQKYSTEDLRKLKLIEEIKRLKHLNSQLQMQEARIARATFGELTYEQWDRVYTILMPPIAEGAMTRQCIVCNIEAQGRDGARKHLVNNHEERVKLAIKEIVKVY